VENVDGQRREEGDEDELILLFPCQKVLGKTKTVGYCSCREGASQHDVIWLQWTLLSCLLCEVLCVGKGFWI